MNHHRVRTLIDNVLTRVIEGGVRADRALKTVLRANRDLDSEKRRRVAVWSLGLSLWRGRLARLTDDRSLWLAVYLVEEQAMDGEDASLIAGVDPGKLAAVLARREEPDDLVEALAFRRSLPRWMAKRWIDQFGPAKADALAEAMNQPGPISIRANLLLTTVDGLRRRLEQEGVDSSPSPLVETALRLRGRPNIVALDSWREGWFEVQDEASQIVSRAVEAKPGETVVDLCAGAGGKTLALAAAMQDRGRIIAVDPDPDRLHDLSVRLRRAGVHSVEIRQGDGRDPGLLSDVRGRVHRVLVDAPCSGLGILRRGPDSRFRIQPDDAARFSDLQNELLQSASFLPTPGGTLVYATCSVDREENETVADAFDSSTFGEAFERKLTRRTWPDVEGCDGFFLAVWSRSASFGITCDPSLDTPVSGRSKGSHSTVVVHPPDAPNSRSQHDAPIGRAPAR